MPCVVKPYVFVRKGQSTIKPSGYRKAWNYAVEGSRVVEVIVEAFVKLIQNYVINGGTK
jgi:hypothetical protein